MILPKKLSAIALIAAMLLICAACGSTETPVETAVPTPEATPTPTPAPTETPAQTDAGVFRADGDVVFDRDGVKVTTAGFGTEPNSGDDQTVLWLDIENGGSKDAYLGVETGSVNGFMTTVNLTKYAEKDGNYEADNEFNGTIPANSNGRYAISYNNYGIRGVNMSTPNELEVCFATSEDEFAWYNYVAAPVVISSGTPAEDVDLSAFGTVALDNEKLLIVFGEQEYDDWSGPEVTVYIENKTDRWVALSPSSAEGDGATSDYMNGGFQVAPGKKDAGRIGFDGAMKELKGIENLSITFRYYDADSFDALDYSSGVNLDPVTVTYPPQVWGKYENGGLSLEVKPKYNNLITVELPENEPDGILFYVRETASMEADSSDGAGWLFSIGKVSEARVRELLCVDMSGMEVFAKDGQGNYYIYYHPTDVRYARATAEEMARDQAQWTMLCEWARNVPGELIRSCGLESKSYNNSVVDIYLARAAWMKDVNATLSTTEFGPVALQGVDGTPYAEFAMHSYFDFAESDKAPDGEYVVLSFPDDNVRLDFFFAPGNYVRVVTEDKETLYHALWFDDAISSAEVMQGWYYAVAELAAVKPFDESLSHFYGVWHEKIAQRGTIDIEWCVAPGKVNVHVRWPESASVADTWEMVATLTDGKLVYENGYFESNEYDENGERLVLESNWNEHGYFYLSDAGELKWHDPVRGGGEDSTFVK